MSARKAITRSKKTFRVKFPSNKNKCTIACESILESHAALYLEISPQSISFESQPSVEIIYNALGEQRKYFPDFRVVLEDASEVDIEIKHEAKMATPKYKKKFQEVKQRYLELGRNFRVMTEKSFRSEPLRSNLTLVRRHSRVPMTDDELQKLKARLSEKAFETFEGVAEIVGGARNVYRLIAIGFLGVDFNKQIDSKSQVWIREMGGSNDSLCI